MRFGATWREVSGSRVKLTGDGQTAGRITAAAPPRVGSLPRTPTAPPSPASSARRSVPPAAPPPACVTARHKVSSGYGGEPRGPRVTGLERSRLTGPGWERRLDAVRAHSRRQPAPGTLCPLGFGYGRENLAVYKVEGNPRQPSPREASDRNSGDSKSETLKKGNANPPRSYTPVFYGFADSES
ncbi:hypothetical protein SKAU_G00023890 [Synaphobranchus kaupii]|uniref:Uncharacterized protein n=1 Tax=Synaphobranchus kaupii TaxID=118154 RepID=A0A9Q1JCH0_SYNKA|nr:hypothetical protein SKAU_G00023890 [Synaphobranchus kaupii]